MAAKANAGGGLRIPLNRILRNTENANLANKRQGMVRYSVCSGLVLHRMKNPRFSALLALVLAASIGSLQAATPPTRIMSAQVITKSGSYVLANDITGNIDIQASDVSVNLDRHTVTGRIIIEGHIGNNTGNPSLLNAHVYNGQIVSSKVGVVISGSSCLVNDLNITVGQSGTPIWIEHGSYNRVQGCVLSVPTGKTGRSVFNLFLTRQNTVLNNTISGIYYHTILKDNQAFPYGTNVGDNTFADNEFANPTQ